MDHDIRSGKEPAAQSSDEHRNTSQSFNCLLSKQTGHDGNTDENHDPEKIHNLNEPETGNDTAPVNDGQHKYSVMVHSRHPLVFCLLNTMLQDDWQLEQCTILCHSWSSPLTIDPNRIVIIDTYSVRSWRQDLSTCQKQNYRSIVLLMPELQNEIEAVEALSLGADAIVEMSGNPKEDLRAAIWSVFQGQTWISPTMSQAFAKHLHRLRIQSASLEERLTAREHDVVSRLVKGLANKEIAGELKISARTVKFHVSNILRKTRLKSRHDLMIIKQAS